MGELRTRLRSALDGVDGWLGLDEAWELHEAARRALPAQPTPTIVEIGSYKGRSAIALGLGVVARGGGRVFAIDPADMEAGQFEALTANLERAGLPGVVEPIRSLSHQERDRFKDGSISVLFVDGSHEYEDVLQDIADWTPKLRPGAIAAFNDPFWPGVGHALQETVGAPGSAFRRPRWADQTVFFDFAPGEPWRRADTVRARRLRLFLQVGRRWRDLHWKIVTNDRVPLWAKRVQLRTAVMLFKGLLPYATPVAMRAHASQGPDPS